MYEKVRIKVQEISMTYKSLWVFRSRCGVQEYVHFLNKQTYL
jgi:hypothetical protein